MKIDKNEFEAFLSSNEIMIIEDNIAKNANCKIFREKKELLVSLTIKSIEDSNITINEIKDLLLNKKTEIINLAKFFLLEENINSLSFGVSITYTIYLFYLDNKSNNELENYIKRRRIPNVNEVLNQLKFAYSKIHE